MKRIIAVVLSLCLLLLLFGCDADKQSETSNETTENTDTTQSIVTPQHETATMVKHEVTLTLDNYLLYFDVVESSIKTQPRFKFSGCLSYAYYDNVSVIVEYSTDNSTENKRIALNTAGNGEVPFEQRADTPRIVGISGTVVFWI